MVFSSAVFLVWFLPITLIIYYSLPKGFKNYFLLLASLLFYSWGAPKFTIILAGSVVLDYYLIKWMQSASSQLHKKLILAASVAISVGFLLYYKYANFFIDNLNSVLLSVGRNEPLPWERVLLPIGISFFTFQKITYGLDVYRGKTEQAKNAAYYLLYVVMFPQLIAGPIVRYNTIARELHCRNHSMPDRVNGFMRFGLGLAKKVLLANVLGEYADEVFDNSYAGLSSGEAWLALLAYAFQIYYDFAGYSDMAIGIGRMLGFTFPENFDSPYTSKSITEFWRRWHITLGHWMRDYLYIPLGGNRVKSPLRLYANLWIVFLISGLWHGASWNFVIWGAYHGFFLAIERMFLLKLLKKLGTAFAWIFTFFASILGWVFFRIEHFNDAVEYLAVLFSFKASDESVYRPIGFWLILFLGVLFAFSSSTPIGKKLEIAFHRGALGRANTITVFTVIVLLYVISLAYIVSSDYNPFIYFRF